MSALEKTYALRRKIVTKRSKVQSLLTMLYSRGNRFENFGKGVIPLALVPCAGETCDDWETGRVKWCIHLVRVQNGRVI